MIIEECIQFPFRCPNQSFGLEIGGHRDRMGSYRSAAATYHGEGGDLLKICFLDPKPERVSVTGVSFAIHKCSRLTQLPKR